MEVRPPTHPPIHPPTHPPTRLPVHPPASLGASPYNQPTNPPTHPPTHPSPSKTLQELKAGGYFPRGSKKQGKKGEDEEEEEEEEEDLLKGCSRWPLTLQLVVAASQDRTKLAMSALGGAVWQLRRSLIDRDLLSMQVAR